MLIVRAGGLQKYFHHDQKIINGYVSRGPAPYRTVQSINPYKTGGRPSKERGLRRAKA